MSGQGRYPFLSSWLTKWQQGRRAGGQYLRSTLQPGDLDSAEAAAVGDWFFPASGSATNVSATVGTVSLAGLSASISVSTEVSASAGAVSLVGQSATVSIASNTNVSGTVADVSIQGQAATVTVSTEVVGTVALVSLDGLPATVSIGGATSVSATVGAVSLSGQAATISLSVEVAALVAPVTIAGQPASVSVSTEVAQSAPATVSLFGLPATISAVTTVAASAGSVSLVGLPASISVSGEQGGAAPDYSIKKKHIVRVGDKLMVFSRKEDAIAAIQSGTPKKQYPAKKGKLTPSEASLDAVAKIEPEETISLPEIKEMAQVYNHAAQYDALIQQHKYDALLALHQILIEREEEDIELLLLAM